MKTTFLGAVLIGWSVAAVGAERPPNILFLHADQHNARVMGCAGHPDVKTPTLDRLAATGVLFQRA